MACLRSLYKVVLWCLLVGGVSCGLLTAQDSLPRQRYTSTFVYDAPNNRYLLITYLYGQPVGSPVVFTPEQYRRYMQVRDGGALPVPDLLSGESSKRTEQPKSMLQFGAVSMNVNGYAELSAGAHRTRTDNPTLHERDRSHRYPDLNQNIHLSLNGSVGERLIFGLDYNTDAPFKQDARRLRLAYKGTEDEILQSVEFGNVNLLPRNSLIQSGGGLFGIYGQMQFGKLRVDMVASRQRTTVKRYSAPRGKSVTPFEISADRYDERRHFFLAPFFYRRFDEAMASLPVANSGIHIDRIEVWITNRRGVYDGARNIVAIDNLADPINVEQIPPANNEGELYAMLSANPAVRNLHQVDGILSPTHQLHHSYERLESARKLEPQEYTLHPALGYISLHRKLEAGDVLAVAFQYTYKGKTYRVGEFTADRPGGAADNLILKLIKSSSSSPIDKVWPLMMKNVYRIASGITLDPKDFKLEIVGRTDSTGIYLPYFDVQSKREESILRLLGFDRLNERHEPHPDGRFDFVEGYTVDSHLGTVIFPSVEPFRISVKKALGADAGLYVFDALYDSTRVAATQRTEHNRFLIRGSYTGGNSTDDTGTGRVRPGSVQVTAGGVTLAEHIDYEVDYATGAVRIINEEILASGVPVDIRYEDQGTDLIQRRSVFGVDLNYAFNPELNIGATLMHLRETPLDAKMAFGLESMRNTLWGVNLNWRKKSTKLTEWLDALPAVKASEPSHISFDAEFAHLIPGHYKSRYAGDYSYIDDFESARSYDDLLNAYSWSLSATPWGVPGDELGNEARLSGDIRYGMHRALLSWYHIDPLFMRPDARYMPAYLRAAPNLLSNHYSRSVEVHELFPFRDFSLSAMSYLRTLNVSYYPEERGPYNLSTDNLLPDGRLSEPQKNWGGMMRALNQTDFEEANIAYVEFWLLDPFIYHPQSKGGNLCLHLGDVSEDVLRDGRKFFENGIPVNDTSGATEQTVWGKVPAVQPVSSGFDNTGTGLSRQDVGLNGLSSEEEKQTPVYADYLSHLHRIVSREQIDRWVQLPVSPLTDPAGDDFVHSRDERYDRLQASVTERYKYYNGTEGNTARKAETSTGETAARLLPDTEDVNGDNTLTDREQYYEYRIELKPSYMKPGQNFIADSRTASVSLPNGKTETVTWYLFKIPIRDYTAQVGNMRDFRSIRFARLCLRNFEEEVHLRFGTFRLVRGSWRPYEQPLNAPETSPVTDARITVGTVNLEENGDRTPVNYVLPPGVTQSIDRSGLNPSRVNEQSLSLQVEDLSPADARAVYKTGNYDLRRYKKLQLFAHAERLINSTSTPDDKDLELFIRLGSDYRQNYYEYARPLHLTKPGVYSSENEFDREQVWPEVNRMNIHLRSLPALKRKRNAAIRKAEASLYEPYIREDEHSSGGCLSVMGQPALSDVRAVMIGVRNRSGRVLSAEVWVDEFRLTDYDEEGGWAARANLGVQLSDMGTVHLEARHYSAGFGALDQRLHERRIDHLTLLDFTAQMDMGRFLPEKWKTSIPLYVTAHNEQSTPLYNPIDPDVLLDDALKDASRSSERDSLLDLSRSVQRSHSVALTNVRVGIKSKNPMPYDPANFSFSYAHSRAHSATPEIRFDDSRNWSSAIHYDYAPRFKPLRPLASMASHKNERFRPLAYYAVNLWPSKIHLSSSLRRYYQEQQMREYTAHSEAIVTHLQHFYWDREMQWQWDLTSDLKINWQSGTHAHIEEPYRRVNRRLDPDGYRIWRDSVMRSIRELGEPLSYRRMVNITYVLPTAMLPKLTWVRGDAAYSAMYNWECGAQTPSGTPAMGHVIRNNSTADLHLTLDLLSFYRQNRHLQSALQGIEGTGSARDTTTRTARLWRYAAMIVRRIQLNLSRSSTTYLPGFIPEIAPFGGQAHTHGSLSPGLPFAFGFTGADFIDHAADRGWLVKNSGRITPATYSRTNTLDMIIRLRPAPHLDITLNMNRTDTRRTEVQYMLDNRPRTYGGYFNMTTIGLRSFFNRGSADNGYRSAAFEQLLAARESIAGRLRRLYEGKVYPDAGFLHGTEYAGKAVDLSSVAFAANSAEVLVPAMRAAYLAGGKAGRVSLNPLPSLLSMLPNWNVVYNGFGELPFMRKIFSRLELSHAYRGVYTVGNYTSVNDWAGYRREHWGFLPDEKGEPRAAMPYLIPMVSLQEAFYPLVGVEISMYNGFTLSGHRRYSRGVLLNTGAAQLIESYTDEWALISSYKWKNLPRLDLDALFGRQKTATPSSEKERRQGGILLRVEYSRGHTQTLIRNIVAARSQATTGNLNNRLRMTADYDLSRYITLRGYYEWNSNKPLVSGNSFPVHDTHYGLSLRFNFLPQ